MNETILGKVSDIFFGIKEGRFGLWITLSGSWSVGTNYTCWDPETVPPSKHAKWTIEDQDKELTKIARKVSKLLNEAKIKDISDLKNKPVEFTTKNGMLNNWRILTEVL